MKAQLVIPMSGIGERFQRAGYELPKPLIKVEGVPIIEHVLDMYPGWDDVVFIVNEDHLQVPEWRMEETLTRLRPTGKIVPIQSHKKGPAWAIKQAASFISESTPVVANYCDFTCRWNIKKFEEKIQSGLDGLIPTYTGFHPHMLRSTAFAYVKKQNEKVIDIQEKKPWTSDPIHEEASSGTYGFGSGETLLRAIEEQIKADDSLNGEYYLSLTYKSMLRRGAGVETFLIDKFMQWGTPEDLNDYEYWSEIFTDLSQLTLPKTNSNSILMLAAGEGQRFVSAGYDIPKPLIPVSGNPMIGQVSKGLASTKMTVVTRSDLNKVNELIDFLKKAGAKTVLVDSLTEGQAESARIGLEQIAKESPGRVFVGACDALLVTDEAINDREMLNNEIWVWTKCNYAPARQNPKAYGWIKRSPDTDLVCDFRIKESPEDIDEWEVITGAFSFGDAASAAKLLQDFQNANIRINNELYLDSVLEFALNRNWIVRAINPDFFVSLGTPQELETFNYWQQCFDEWPRHAYKLETDPFI